MCYRVDPNGGTINPNGVVTVHGKFVSLLVLDDIPGTANDGDIKN